MLRFLQGLLVCALLAFATPANAQHAGHGTPSHMEASPVSVKTLDPEQVTAYLEGRGMGLARAAEMNAYPGPLHVLELAEGLALTPAQRQAAETLRAEMLAEARPLGQRIVDAEQALDALFAAGAATAEAVERMTVTIGELQGRLRAAHLKAHLGMREVLTPEQVARYDALRGHAAKH